MTRCITGLLCLVALAGCRPAEQRAADTAGASGDSAATVEAPAAPAPAQETLRLAALAGKWSMRSVPESGDTTATTFVLTATADSTGWTMTFPNRPPLPMRIVALAGDSLVSEAGPYASVRRRGVQVTTRSTLRLQGGKLVGRSVARYQTTGPDSVLQLRTEGTRQP